MLCIQTIFVVSFLALLELRRRELEHGSAAEGLGQQDLVRKVPFPGAVEVSAPRRVSLLETVAVSERRQMRLCRGGSA